MKNNKSQQHVVGTIVIGILMIIVSLSTGFMISGDIVEAEHSTQGDTSSTYTLKGLPNEKITWAGTGGTTVWCNTSGDYNEYMEINLSVNASDNVTEIRIFLDDLNDTSDWINASNISVQFSSNNITWGNATGNWTAFTDGGSNVTCNSSQWTEANGFYGPNPFTYGGITDTNRSVYCIFKLTIPSDAITDTFWSSASDSYKIYIGTIE